MQLGHQWERTHSHCSPRFEELKLESPIEKMHPNPLHRTLAQCHSSNCCHPGCQLLGVFTVMHVVSCCIAADTSSCCAVALAAWFLFRRMIFAPLSSARRTPVEKAEAASATALCAGLVRARCAPTFTCGDLLLGRRGLLFFGDLVILRD